MCCHVFLSDESLLMWLPNNIITCTINYSGWFNLMTPGGMPPDLPSNEYAMHAEWVCILKMIGTSTRVYYWWQVIGGFVQTFWQQNFLTLFWALFWVISSESNGLTSFTQFQSCVLFEVVQITRINTDHTHTEL